MLTAAMLACAFSVLWTAVVVFEHWVSRGALAPFTTLWLCWLITAGLFLWWGLA